MDYQYKSIHRGEHSIFGQIRKEGVDPEKHIFFFNLRSYDRLNRTAELKRQEEKSGVSYQQVQRANAEEIMGSDIHGAVDQTEKADERDNENAEKEREQAMKDKKKFESVRDPNYHPDPNLDTISPCAMLNGKKVSEVGYKGEEQDERENYVQEELYVHGKLLIADDRVVICGSSNINDRVSVRTKKM